MDGNERIMDDDRGIGWVLATGEESRDEALAVRARGCWRIRRRPDAPRPCSCSAMMGDLESFECRAQADLRQTHCVIVS